MLIGLSYSRCVLDIVEERVDVDDVLVIIARTDFDPRNNDQWAVRGLYELGAFTFGAYYNRASNYTAGVAGVSKKYEALRGAVMYTMGASEFHLNYGRASNGEQMTLGYNYNLSKRTKLYGFYTVTDNSSNFSYFGATDRRGNALKASSMAVGVRHNF